MSVKRNPNLGPSQMRARKRRLFLIRATILTFFVLLILFGLAIFSGHQRVKIQTIILLGNASVSDAEILSIVNRDIAGRYWYLFSKSNSLIFPRFKIKKDILNEIKTINQVDISWKDWQEIEIVLVERKPHSVWCGEDILVQNSLCYFVDREGYVFSQAPIFSGSMFIKNYGLLTPVQANPIGGHFLTIEKYQQIFNLIQILEQNKLSIISLFFDGYDYRFALDC
jgi:cell division septal protein FtsQ